MHTTGLEHDGAVLVAAEDGVEAGDVGGQVGAGVELHVRARHGPAGDVGDGVDGDGCHGGDRSHRPAGGFALAAGVVDAVRAGRGERSAAAPADGGALFVLAGDVDRGAAAGAVGSGAAGHEQVGRELGRVSGRLDHDGRIRHPGDRRGGQQAALVAVGSAAGADHLDVGSGQVRVGVVGHAAEVAGHLDLGSGAGRLDGAGPRRGVAAHVAATAGDVGDLGLEGAVGGPGLAGQAGLHRRDLGRGQRQAEQGDDQHRGEADDAEHVDQQVPGLVPLGAGAASAGRGHRRHEGVGDRAHPPPPIGATGVGAPGPAPGAAGTLITRVAAPTAPSLSVAENRTV